MCRCCDPGAIVDDEFFSIYIRCKGMGIPFRNRTKIWVLVETSSFVCSGTPGISNSESVFLSQMS